MKASPAFPERSLRALMSTVLIVSLLPTLAFGEASEVEPATEHVKRSPITKHSALPSHVAAGGKTAASAPAEQPDYVPGEVLVRFGSALENAARTRAHAKAGAIKSTPLKGAPGVEKVRLDETVSVESAVEKYRKTPGVVSAQPNYVYHTASLPNDPRFDQLWGMHNEGQTGGTPDADIDAPEAWDIETGSGDVIVAVIDTGVDYNHPDLAPNIWVNEGEIPGNGIDDDGNGYVDDVYGYDFANYDGDPMDDHSHGTHCAGTIGAVGDNGIGVAGVAWNVKIMPVKFLTADGWGTTEAAVEAIAYADMMGAHILSNSWGGGWYDQLLYDAIESIDGLFVAAAGNDMTNTDSMPFYPACYELDNIVSVGATDHDDNVAWFSNFGQESVDVFAPGDQVLSTVLAKGPQFAPNVTSVIFSDDLSSLDDWDTSQYNANPWFLDEGTYTSPPSSAAHLGYANDENSWIKRTEPIDLTGAETPALGFRVNYDVEQDFDHIRAHVSTGGVEWTAVGSLTGNSNGEFEQAYFDIASLAGEPSVYVAFSLESDYTVASDEGFIGAWIDDVEIVEAEILMSDRMDTLDNWDTTQYAINPWTLTTDLYVSPPSAAAHLDYVNDEDSWLKLETPIDLSAVTDDSVALMYKAFVSTEWGLDPLNVWASTDGVDWTLLRQHSGDYWMFESYNADLTEFVGEPEVYVAFSLASDSSVASDWWFMGVVVDDVSIAVGTWVDAGYANAYDRYSGTSMATPHVSGLAALILSQKPELTADLVKSAIMDTADVLPTLKRRAVTEGRINAHSAMLDHWAPVLVDDIVDTYSSVATMTITAIDDSAIDYIAYKFDEGDWVRVRNDVAEAEFAIPGGRRVTYFAVDEHGNTSAPASVDFTIERGEVSYVSIEGESRYLTAVEMSKRTFPRGAYAVVIATGVSWPDALGGTALAGVAGGPVLLTKPTGLPSEVAEEVRRLAPVKAYILGGTSAVSQEVETALAAIVSPEDIIRLEGSDRYETARLIADEVIALAGDEYDGTAFVATGANFPDALAASPIASAKGWPILLADSSGRLSVPDEVSSTVILGGAAAVSDGIQAALEAKLGQSNVARRGGTNRYGTSALVAALGVNQGMYWEGVGIATGTNFPDALAGGVMLGSMNTVLLLTPGTKLSSNVSAPLMLNKELIQTVDFLGGTTALSGDVRAQVRTAVE